MEPNQETPPVNQPTTPITPPIVSPKNKTKKSHKALFFLLGIFIVLILVGGVGGGYYLGRSSIIKELNPSSPAIPPKDPDVFKGSPTPTPIKILKSEELYSINLPTGWKKVSEKNRSDYNDSPYNDLSVLYENLNDDYLLVTVNPSGYGVGADQSWSYELTQDKNKIKIISSEPLCTSAEGMCSIGNNKLEILIKSTKESAIKSNDYYFLAGNKKNETNVNTDIYKQILEGIVFK